MEENCLCLPFILLNFQFEQENKAMFEEMHSLSEEIRYILMKVLDTGQQHYNAIFGVQGNKTTLEVKPCYNNSL